MTRPRRRVSAPNASSAAQQSHTAIAQPVSLPTQSASATPTTLFGTMQASTAQQPPTLAHAKAARRSKHNKHRMQPLPLNNSNAESTKPDTSVSATADNLGQESLALTGLALPHVPQSADGHHNQLPAAAQQPHSRSPSTTAAISKKTSAAAHIPQLAGTAATIPSRAPASRVCVDVPDIDADEADATDDCQPVFRNDESWRRSSAQSFAGTSRQLLSPLPSRSASTSHPALSHPQNPKPQQQPLGSFDEELRLAAQRLEDELALSSKASLQSIQHQAYFEASTSSSSVAASLPAGPSRYRDFIPTAVPTLNVDDATICLLDTLIKQLSQPETDTDAGQTPSPASASMTAASTSTATATPTEPKAADQNGCKKRKKNKKRPKKKSSKVDAAQPQQQQQQQQEETAIPDLLPPVSAGVPDFTDWATVWWQTRNSVPPTAADNHTHIAIVDASVGGSILQHLQRRSNADAPGSLDPGDTHRSHWTLVDSTRIDQMSQPLAEYVCAYDIGTAEWDSERKRLANKRDWLVLKIRMDPQLVSHDLVTLLNTIVHASHPHDRKHPYDVLVSHDARSSLVWEAAFFASSTTDAQTLRQHDPLPSHITAESTLFRDAGIHTPRTQ
ncbi:hypothetical protein BC831DRAFT_472033 [Entophlyctis helioformis]|nr:hypothetical protein BC831DRAFT_472033 [Entophlyctis helioformis]